MFYSEDVIEEVRLRNDIYDVVSEYVRLEKKGIHYFGLCPFHNEKTPSFSVTQSKQMFFCYGCGKGGSVIQFIMDVQRFAFLDSIRFLAERVGYDLPTGNDPQEKEKMKLRKSILNINRETAKFYYKNLLLDENKEARQYLIKRGLSNSIIKKFGIGYSTTNWDSLQKFLIENNYNREDIESSGLIIKSKKGGFFDRFRNRVIFPIIDITGNVIGFGGRVLDDSLPKYMNSPESIVYNKRQTLYNLNLAKQFANKKIIVVEGYMDVISLYQSGVRNVVASLGTALTESQGRLLKKYTEEVIIIYDSDSAGEAATIRGLDILDRVGANVRVVRIPKGKDPDEFIRTSGLIRFNKLLDNSLSLIDYKISLAKNSIDTKTTEGKINFINNVAKVLSKIRNKVEVEMYIKKISQEYKISEESIKGEILKKTLPKKIIKPQFDDSKNKKQKYLDNAKTKYEEIILCLLTIDNKLYFSIKDLVTIEDFEKTKNKNIAEVIFEKCEKNIGIVPAELFNILDKEDIAVYSKILQDECNFDDNIKAAKDLIGKIKVNKAYKRKDEILKLLREENNNLTEGDVKKLKQELISLTLKERK